MTAKMDGLERIKERLKGRLSAQRRASIRKYLKEPAGFFFSRDLIRLATIYGTDKLGEHRYVQHYAHHFQHLRNKKITLLEIGIGGREVPEAGGGSLRMWRRYFSKGKIAGVDFYDKSPHNERRIRTFRGDQSDEKFLGQLIQEIGHPEIIIDDGSHINGHVLKTFQVLFPLLADNGIYVVEDTQTSYWPDFGGSSDNLLQAPTSMCLFKNLVDGLNHEEFIRPGYAPSYYDKHIVSMHFYHNMVFIQKGMNNEGSNYVRNNTTFG